MSTRAEIELARAMAYERCWHRCEICGDPITRDTFHAHHRQMRSQGGPHTAGNLLALCGGCHERACHAGPRLAYGLGWLVPAGRDPRTVPVLVNGGREWVLLNDSEDANHWHRLDRVHVASVPLVHLSPADGLVLCGQTGALACVPDGMRTDPPCPDCHPEGHAAAIGTVVGAIDALGLLSRIVQGK